MKEKEIIDSILSRLNMDKSLNVIQPTIGRGNVTYPGDEETTYWVVRNQIGSSSLPIEDINGNIIGWTKGNRPETSPEGDQVFVISRDSILCDPLIKRILGKTSYFADGKTHEIEVSSASFFDPNLFPLIDARNGFIKSSSRVLAFKSLLEERKKQVEIEELRKELQFTVSETERDELMKKIKEREESLKKLREEKRRHIVESSLLRDQPILDPLQEKIKRSRILDGQLIITGGPGTGKTTSLIQRINFLISNTIKDYRKDLSEEDLEFVNNRESSWIFFSPSELLKQYLKNVMAKENLNPDDQKVVTWEIHRRDLFRRFELINPDKQRPFLAIQNDRPFFNMDGHSLIILLRDFEKTFVNLQGVKFQKIIQAIDDNDIDLSFMTNIIEQLKQYESVSTINNFILFYNNLNSQFYNQIKRRIDETNEKIDKLTAEISISISKARDIETIFKEYVLKSIIDKKNAEEPDAEELLEEEDENVVLDESEIETHTYRLIKLIIRKYALASVDKKVKINAEEKKIIGNIEKIFDLNKIKALGNGIFINKYFNKILKDFELNILREIHIGYKKFRKEILLTSDYITLEGKEVLIKSIENKNIKIHKEEMDLILLIIFRLIHSLYKINHRIFSESKDIFLQAFKNNSKAVIAIDESTDFSLLELSCMSYLSHPKYNCVTLCGDIMQRVESKGITKWEDYTNIFPDVEIGNLEISYRQTENLLDIGKKLYKSNTGEELIIKPAYPRSEKDPQPFLFYSDDFEKKVEWLAQRIYEIHSTYGNKLPSIAIFFADNNSPIEYEKELNKCEILSDNDIKVVNCPKGNILGDAQNVRLFNVKYIKGLEFEAVFFIDIDNMKIEEPDLLDRYIYVGVSRASFYLGMTVNNELPDRLSYLSDYFVEGNSW